VRILIDLPKYYNDPTDELIKIINFMCDKHNISGKLKHELVKVSYIIIKQNYFQFQNTFYIQEAGLDMGVPTFSIFSGIYLKNIENSVIYGILINTL
jgi:hypothetical protein